MILILLSKYLIFDRIIENVHQDHKLFKSKSIIFEKILKWKEIQFIQIHDLGIIMELLS